MSSSELFVDVALCFPVLSVEMVIVSCHGVVFLEPELEETVALGFADSAVVAIVQPVSVEGGKSAGVLMRFALVLSAVALVLSAVALVLSAVALVLSAVDSNSKVDLLVMLSAVLNGSFCGVE